MTKDEVTQEVLMMLELCKTNSGLSREKVAGRLGVTISAINNWVKGSMPAADRWESLKELAGVK